MSAMATQPAKIPHARQAYFRLATLRTTTSPATTAASQTSVAGGDASEYEPPKIGYHCHGPPTIPGSRACLTRVQANRRAAVNGPGGCSGDDVRSAIASSTA